MIVPRERVTVSSPDLFIAWMVGFGANSFGGGDLVLAQSGQADRTAGARRRCLRQGPRRAGLQALWRNRSAPRRPGLHHHARTHRAPCAAAHRNAGGRQPRPADAADAHAAAACDDGRRVPRSTRCATTSPRWSTCSTNISTSRAAKAARNRRSRISAIWCAMRRKRRRERAPAARTALSWKCQAARCFRSSANALRRCVTNLIDNALKHGRQVRVSLTRDARFAEIHGRR